MKKRKTGFAGKYALATLSILVLTAVIGCSSVPKAKVGVMETKGTALGDAATPNWVRIYVSEGITGLQKLTVYRNMYCIVGEESGANKQFTNTWADNFSAQQRIGALLRTSIQSAYQATARGQAQSYSVTDAVPSTGSYQQEIDNMINSIVNVSYSGAFREADWWVLTRRYDPDVKEAYIDEYTAWVLYTIPKTILNQQVADSMLTIADRDSDLYDVTIEIARSILVNGIDSWGSGAGGTGTVGNSGFTSVD